MRKLFSIIFIVILFFLLAILSVHATDRDLGTNAEIVYSIVSGGKDDFSIAESTGETIFRGHTHIKVNPISLFYLL